MLQHAVNYFHADGRCMSEDTLLIAVHMCCTRQATQVLGLLTMSTTCFVCSSKVMQFLNPASLSRSLRGRTCNEQLPGVSLVQRPVLLLLVQRLGLCWQASLISSSTCIHGTNLSICMRASAWKGGPWLLTALVPCQLTHPDAYLYAIQVCVVSHGLDVYLTTAKCPLLREACA